MPALSTFGQWLSQTRDSNLTDPKYLINEAQKQSYALSHFLNKASPFRNIRGGTRITERVKISDQGNFAELNPGDPRTLNRINTTRAINFEWTFVESNISWTEQEVMLNDTGDELTQYKNLRDSFRQDAVSDHVNGLDSRFFAAPNNALMETPTAADKRQAYSIPCFITENGLNPQDPATSTAWTTVAGQNSSVAAGTWWRNQVSSYTSNTATDTTGIISAMDDMDVKLNFKATPKNSNGTFQDDGGDKICIFTNRIGANFLRNLYRTGQDTFWNGKAGAGGRATNDAAYPTLMFNNRDVEYITQLDTELLGATNSTGVGGGTTTNTNLPYVSPRYFWTNTKFCFPVFHKARMMYEREIKDGGIIAPDTEVMFYSTWYNIVANSRRRQGLVRPATAA